jgi:hypothetical protein
VTHLPGARRKEERGRGSKAFWSKDYIIRTEVDTR